LIYNDFSVKSFRHFKKLKINELERINLIAGKNNTGKTSILEAIYLHSGYYNSELPMRIENWRGFPGWTISDVDEITTPWDNLFYNFDNQDIIYFESNGSYNGKRSTKIKVLKDYSKIIEHLNRLPVKGESSSAIKRALEITHEDVNGIDEYYYVFGTGWQSRIPAATNVTFQTIMIPSRMRFPPRYDANRFSNVKKEKKDDLIIKSLKMIDDRIEDITVYTAGVEPSLYIDVGMDNYIPLLVSGEGVVKIMNIILSISDAENGVIMIDEIENGFHYSILDKVWQIIDEVSKIYNCQVFASTHSMENIKAAHKHFMKNDEYGFRLYRFDLIDKDVEVIQYDKKSLETSLSVGCLLDLIMKTDMQRWIRW
jgi:AAA15 family ATPase/GTPase